MDNIQPERQVKDRVRKEEKNRQTRKSFKVLWGEIPSAHMEYGCLLCSLLNLNIKIITVLCDVIEEWRKEKGVRTVLLAYGIYTPNRCRPEAPLTSLPKLTPVKNLEDRRRGETKNTRCKSWSRHAEEWLSNQEFSTIMMNNEKLWLSRSFSWKSHLRNR